MTNEDNSIINIHAWLGRVTLDAIGESEIALLFYINSPFTSSGLAAFGYKFGALDDEDNELANIVNKLLYDPAGL